jgi:hypothetical protein
MKTTALLLQLPRLLDQVGAFFMPDGSDRHAGTFKAASKGLRSPPLREIRLGRGEVTAIAESWMGGSLRVLEGTVWVTDSPATGDYVVESGQVFALVGEGPWVVQALEDAVIEL